MEITSTKALSLDDYKDFEFIVSDLESNLTLSPAEQMDRLRKDPWAALSGLKGPTGFDLPLSRDAQERFARVARRGLEALGPLSRIHRLEEVVKELKRELSSLLSRGLVPGPDDAHDLFTAATRTLESRYEELTYHVPCSLVVERSYPIFEIGPVTFVLRERFFEENGPAVKKAIAEFEHPQAMEKLAASVRTFYSGFQWIASITVPPCDAEISKRHAHAGIQRVLDVFKLIVGGKRGRNVKQAYDLTPPSHFAELVSVPEGSLRLQFGWSGDDAVTNDHWYDQLKAGPAWPLLRSLLLKYWKGWGELNEIDQRFLDALAWHSDAISEQDPGARIIKFWTSIERTLRTAPGDIDTRAAVLASDTPEEFAKVSGRFEHAYRRGRNDIVHGNASRGAESWYEESMLVSEEASKNVLFQYLYAMTHIRSLPGATDRKKIRSWLNELDKLGEKLARKPAGA